MHREKINKIIDQTKPTNSTLATLKHSTMVYLFFDQ